MVISEPGSTPQYFSLLVVAGLVGLVSGKLMLTGLVVATSTVAELLLGLDVGLMLAGLVAAASMLTGLLLAALAVAGSVVGLMARCLYLSLPDE